MKDEGGKDEIRIILAERFNQRGLAFIPHPSSFILSLLDMRDGAVPQSLSSKDS
jgi:hypothetical protein